MFFVPVRISKAGALTLKIGRLRCGERVGLAFTSESSLALTLGPAQQWIRLDREALAEMLEPLGVEHIRVDTHRVGEPRRKPCHPGPRYAHSGAASHQDGAPLAQQDCRAAAYETSIPRPAPGLDTSVGRQLAADPPAGQRRGDRSALSRGRRMLLDGPRTR
ncbi:MAG TPA: SAV_915 family protein [Trebonia sp.]